MEEQKKRVAIYLGLAFGVAWALLAAIPLNGYEYGTSMQSMNILSMCMMTPALSMLLTRVITKEGMKGIGLNPMLNGNKGIYVFSYLCVPALVISGGAVYFLLFSGQFDPKMSAVLQSVEAAGGQDMDAVKKGLLLNLAVSMAVAPFVNLLVTMGEELGWRGYLLPRLCKLMGVKKAILASGFIWGLWHAPMIAMGHNYGKGYAGYPWLGIIAMVIFCVALGSVLSYVTLKSRSVFPAGMIHSAINALVSLPVLFMTGTANILVGPTILGVIGGIPLIVLAALCFRKAELPAESSRDGSGAWE